MHGVSLGERWPYDVEISVMREMHWSWSDLREAPFDLIDVIVTEMSASNRWQRKKQEYDAAMSK